MSTRFSVSRQRLASRTAIGLGGACVAIAAIAIAWSWGPAEQGYFDSAFYVDGARHLARGDGYVCAYAEGDDLDYEPITHWAPGTSVMLTVPILLGAQPLTAASIVLGACYVAAVLLIYALGVGLAGRTAWPAAALASLVFALQPSTLIWLDAVLSDLPWTTFALLNLGIALWVMRAPRLSLGLRIGWGLCLVWLVLVRYAGLLFVPGLLAGTVLGMQSERAWWKRPLRLWPTLLTAAVGVGLWNLRNKRASNEPLGGWMFVDSDARVHFERASTAAFIWVKEALQEASAAGLETQLSLLLWAALASTVLLAVMSVRASWRELLLVGLTAAGYFAAMVFTASVTVIATLSETRFWIVCWPLALLFVLVACLRAAPRWCIAPKLVVLAAALCVLGLYATKARREAPGARAPRGLLSPAWASATEVVPQPDQCYVFVNDPRPFMLHRALPPIHPIPQSLEEFEKLAAKTSSACIVTTDATKRLRLSTTAERRRVGQNAVLDALRAQQRLKQIDRRAGVRVFRLQ